MLTYHLWYVLTLLMWSVYEHRHVSKQLDSIPKDVLKRYEKWKDIVTISGPQGLRKMKGLRDEALSGPWKGHRSSRLNKQYRVIYKIIKDRVFIKVVSVTPHDYRRS